MINKIYMIFEINFMMESELS